MSASGAMIEGLSCTNTNGAAVADNPVSLEVAQYDRHGYLFGHKLAASLSPLFHNTIYAKIGLNWGQVRFDSSDIKTFLRLIQHPQFYGASVTMPNKVAILPYLDEITPECQDVGACNTIYVRERQGRRIFCGTNTDVIGIRESFYQNVPSPDSVFHHRPALVIGGGGAARSAVYALRKWMKVKEIYLVNRDASEVASLIADCTSRGYGDGLIHVSSASQAKDLESPGAIVSCVPDFEPASHEEKQARQTIVEFLRKERKGAMLEMCYNPTPFTKLGAIAEENEWQVILGTEALIWQGLEQDRYWTEREVTELPVATVKELIAKNLSERAASSRL